MGEIATSGRAVTPVTEQDSNVDHDPVSDLVGRAAGHPLGVDFLRRGTLDAVSATFGVHAFVVEAARVRLASGAPARSEVPEIDRRAAAGSAAARS